MRKYLFVFSNALQSLTEYRLSFLLDLLGNTAFSIVLYLFWRFLASSGLDTGPYDPITLGYYFLLVAVVEAVIGLDAHSVSNEIRNGEIIPHLLRPFSYMWMKFSATFPNAFLKLFVGVLVFVLLLFFGFPVALDFTRLPLFVLALIFATLGNYLIYFTVGLIAFWTRQTWGAAAFVSISSSLVSGRLIPIDLLPLVVARISQWLPFRYLVFFPVQIFLGKLSSEEILVGFLLQGFWVGALYLLSVVVWKAGQKELEAVGI